MSAALLGLWLVLSPAWPQDTRPSESEDTLARIEALEARLSEAEARLQAAEQLAEPTGLRGTSGGVVVEKGETVRDAVALGGPVEVYGRVKGPAVAFGGDVAVHAGGQVEGDAVAFGGEVRVQEGGVVRGDRVAMAPTGRSAWLPALTDPSGQGRDLARQLVLLLTFAGAGVLLVGLFPAHVARIARDLEERPWQAGVGGAVATIAGGVSALVLTLTIVGIPLALLIAALLGLAWLLGFVGLCQVVGDRLPWMGMGARRWLAFLGGVALLAFFGALPVIGQLGLAAGGLFGAGAAVQTRLGTRPVS